jgi:hypothetical protein
VIRTLASMENPLFSQASMSVAAAASSRRASLNQRITRRRTFSVSVARSAWVIGRIRMSNDEVHEIRHPECALVMKTKIIVGYPDDDRSVTRALVHVNSIETLQAS